MKITTRSAVLLALGASICAGTLSQTAGMAQTPGACNTVHVVKTSPVVVSKVVPLRAVTVPTPRVVPVVTSISESVVYSPLNNKVRTLIPVRPLVAAPIDTLKLQIANRMHSGLVTGKLTSVEADEIQSRLDQIALTEANLKLTYGGVNVLVVSNLMPKFHMINNRLTDLLSNTNTADYLPSVENRRAELRDFVLVHQAQGNLTPAESEQLLVGLNGVSDEYVNFNATGGTLTADELEQTHLDLFNVRKKLIDRIEAPLARTYPEVIVHESELLKTIQLGMTAHALSADEGNKLICKYNELVLSRKALSEDTGYSTREMAQLIAQIDNLKFVIDRELSVRTVAGQSTHF